MKKFTLILTVLLMLSIWAVAQIKLVVCQEGGVRTEFVATSVDSIIFVDSYVEPDEPIVPDEPTKPEIIEGKVNISAVRNKLSINQNDFTDFAGLYVSSTSQITGGELSSYQWQYSTDNVTWSEYTFGHGADWDNIRPNKVGYYRCLLTYDFEGKQTIYQSNTLTINATSGASVDFSSKLPVFLVRTAEDFPRGGSDSEMKAKRSVDVKILWNQNGGSVTDADVNNADMLYYDRKARMNYRGSSSLNNPKKSYAFVTGDKNCDPSKRGYVKTKKQKMFGEDAHKDWVLYASYQDDTYMRNVLSYHQYAEMTGFWAPKCRFVELYVDGSYDGIYVFMDKITQDETRVNINEDTGYILKFDKTDISDRNKTFITSHTGRLNVQERDHAFEVDFPEDDDPAWDEKLSAIKQKVDELETAILNNDYEKLATIIDYQSWADWFIINEFTKNVDAYRISCVFTLNSIDDKIVANPIWDYELGWGNRAPFNADTNTKTLMVETQSYYNDAFATPFWWIGYGKSGCNGILGDCKFKELVKERWAKHTAEGGALNEEVLRAKIDSLAKVLSTSSTATVVDYDYLSGYWVPERTRGLNDIINAWEGCSEETFVAKPFSVSATETVTFSSGNLQYHPANDEWRFAPTQIDYIGEENANISATYNGWIDLFGWGTGDNPTKNSESYDDFTGGDYENYQTFVDWGMNKIGDDESNTWRSLTKEEWKYIIEERSNASSLYGLGRVEGVNGLIILPDEWQCPDSITFKSGYGFDLQWDNQQEYSIVDWAKMEKSGAVFLPAAGLRSINSTYDINISCSYWIGTLRNTYSAHILGLNRDGLFIGSTHLYQGLSVRLVQDN